MIECGANEVPEDTMLEAIITGHKEIQKMCAFLKDVQSKIGKPKINFVSQEVPAEMFEAIKDFAIDKVKAALDTDDKNIREERLAPLWRRSTRNSTRFTLRRSPRSTSASTNCRNSSSAAGSWTRASGSTAAAWMRSAPWRLKLD